MRSPTFVPLVAPVLFVLQSVHAAVTIYTAFDTDSWGNMAPTPTSTAYGAAYTGPAAYNLTELTPPVLPNPMPALNFPVQLFTGPMANMSIPQKGNFMGVSIELSVANQVLGKNSSLLQVPFLNYMSELRSRFGSGAQVRVGGNSQETTELHLDGFDSYSVINKTKHHRTNIPTETPDVDISIDLLYTMMNISSLVNIDWYFGLPFGDPTNTSGIATIASFAEQVLGPRLIALQLGNEPDLYIDRKRTRPYALGNFMDEWGKTIDALNPVLQNKQILLGPSICCGIDGFDVPDFLGVNFVGGFNESLKVFAVQHYPENNCPQDGKPPRNPQDYFDRYLKHSAPVHLLEPYLAASSVALAAGKPFVMYETNTASCAGFAGVSDSFGAALWAVDYTMQMAFSNFTAALFHVGGQNAAYNMFTSPPTSMSMTHGWTTGSIFYSFLVVAEALGPTNTSQVVDLYANGNSDFTPGYVIYENGAPARVLLINYMNDPSGASDVTANVMIGGGTSGEPAAIPNSVTVKHLSADSVSKKYDITWAGQTMGGQYESDGLLKGDMHVETVTCDPTTGCPIRLKAPSLALVFLNPAAQHTTSNKDVKTFATTVTTGVANPTIDPAVLATSNGRGGPQNGKPPLGSTSHGPFGSGAISLRLEGYRWMSLLGSISAGVMIALGV